MKSIGPYVISATPPGPHGAIVNGQAVAAQVSTGALETGQPGPLVPPPGFTESAAQKSPNQKTLKKRRRGQPKPGNPKSGDDHAESLNAEGQKSVLSRPGQAIDAVPMHGIDRLTGMPVLLHRLPEFVVPADIPESVNLLPVYEVDIWDGQPYAITELPLSAVPATHPGSAALGALRALSALHAAGQVHGGLNAGQLWQVGREVRLAGAGLPWQPGASPTSDLSALGQALDHLGGRPAALNALETMTAAQALTVLEAALHSSNHDDRQPGWQAGAPVDPPSVQTETPPPVLQAPVTQPQQLRPPDPVPEERPAAVPVASASYRSAEDIIVIGEVDEGGSAGILAPEHTSDMPPVRLVPAPIRIGFEELEPLPDWTPEDRPERQQADGNTPSLQPADPHPESLYPESPHPEPTGLPETPRSAQAAVGRTTRFVPAGVGSQTSAPDAPPAAGAAGVQSAANRGQPLRIGWEEDHSWRVVKSGPERRGSSAARLPTSALNWPVLALVLLALLGGAAYWYFGRSGTPAAACCTLAFTVSGSSEPVTVTLVQAPPGSPLQPGALIGSAPGVLKFPDAPGRYTLKFTAAGHGTLSGTVTVPSSQPFGIVLK